MLFKSKISAIVRQAGKLDNYSGSNCSKVELRSLARFASSSNNPRIDVEKLEVPSRYDDVPISNKSYFDFVWENREKHFNKVAMVSFVSFNFRRYIHFIFIKIRSLLDLMQISDHFPPGRWSYRKVIVLPRNLSQSKKLWRSN